MSSVSDVESSDVISIPTDRLHDSGIGATGPGIALATMVAIGGAAMLGFGYGAVIALCGQKYVNVAMTVSFPFCMHIPAQLGFMWGHVREQRSRRWIERGAFLICCYSICVGWLFAVLDGPGLVLSPMQLAGYLADVSVHSLWAEGFKQDFIPLAPYLLTIRFGALAWILLTGLMSMGAATPYPYCQHCRRWMEDQGSLRLAYEPSSNDEVYTFASDLVGGNYDGLLSLDQPIDPKAKGLAVNVFGCQHCKAVHVLNATWYRSQPDPEKNDTEQLLEAGTGKTIVSGLRVTAGINDHFAQLCRSKAA